RRRRHDIRNGPVPTRCRGVAALAERGPLMPSSLAALVLAAALVYEPTSATVERRVASMGTTVDLVVRMKYREQALEASEAALRELSRVETLLTTWKRGGELDRIDEAPAGRPVRVSRELADLLAEIF